MKKAKPLPIIMRYDESANPFPIRAIQATSTVSAEPAFFGQSWAHSDDHCKPFDFCKAMRHLITDISHRSPEFHHVDASRILVAVSQARGGRVHGLQARVTPLRFAAGALTRRRLGMTYRIQRYFLGDHEYLYLMTFYLPRYLNQSFDQKFITLFHELYHIHEDFNGALRRHGGRYHVHTVSQHEYNQKMAHFAREYLAGGPDRKMSDFLRMDFSQLQKRHGAVTGIVVPRPHVVPIG